MSDNIIIRKANATDLEGILALINSPEADDGKAMELRDGNTIFQSILDDSNYFQFVATSEQGIIGIVTLVIIVQMTHEGTGSALITDLIIAPNVEKTPITTQLLKHTTELAQEYGCYKTIIHSDYQPEETSLVCKELGFEECDSGFMLPE